MALGFNESLLTLRRFALAWQAAVAPGRRCDNLIQASLHFADLLIAVLRLDIAVDNAPVVGELQRVAQWRNDCQ